MIEKTWINWNGDCPNCGDSVRVLTDAVQDYPYPVAYDSDKAECVSCKWKGNIVVGGDDDATAWLDEGNIDELDDMGNDPL